MKELLNDLNDVENFLEEILELVDIMEERYKAEERKEIIGEEWRKISRIFDRYSNKPINLKYNCLIYFQVSIGSFHIGLIDLNCLVYFHLPSLSRP